MSNSRNSTRPMLAPSSRKRSGSTTDDYQPTTPRLSARFSDQPAEEIPAEDSTLTTPTRGTFKFPAGSSNPTQQYGDGVGVSRENSRRSVHSHQSSDSQDIDMDDGDDDGQDQAGSDNESDEDGKPSRKKKKGQRFYCTDFPPCNLSFTRSEHLARHIRKHTGERPFECHCSRRFSRLDNLRQHAQTVHVNEEIPGDSLAATGTRFQRQIRTDRVRPPNVRPRASTAGSGGQSAYSRGHSRNLSASSVLSTTSSLAMSDIGESRPRPSPLMLNQDPVARARLSLDTFNPAIPNNGPQFGYYQQSPGGYSSPTSSNFSTGEGSPRFQASMQSPSLPIARSSFYNGTRTPSRRLSVPSGVSPYSPQAASYQPVYFAPLPSGPAPQYSNTNSMVASPTASTFSHHRRESDAELEWRRRTWHPGTHANYASRPATSGLAYNQTPDDVAPALASQPAASQITRLPGIESFDHAPPPPAVPARNITSPMQIDSGRRSSILSGPIELSTSAPGDRRSIGWEHNLHQGLNKLEIAHPPVDQSRILPSQRLPAAPLAELSQQSVPGYALPQLQPPADIRPVADDRANKRQAWYGGPMGPPQGSQPIMIAHRTSPESSSSEGIPTPSTSQGRELHPAIMHANGMVELQPPDAILTDEQRALQAHYQGKPEPTRADSGFHSYVHMAGQAPTVYMMQAGHNMQVQSPEWRPAPINQRANPDMGRLEALVAVATSENRAVEHRG
ncbi:unnamed protein product [Aureobasidium uvarum]|uniref:C2H2-type domain-containing protein n=1 Tax=Aureobasidium uvarum TaxID=2773716 RepID=A0A9N8PP70_9PEZI|nr:unnamed protein product [Aureobasidium uvarum]